MTPFQLSLLAFGSGVLIVGAMVYLVAVPLRALGGAFSGGSRRLRRVPNVFDEAPAAGVSQKIDQGFNRLVLESGTQIVPMTAFLMTLAGGLTGGGIVWLYTNEPVIGLGGALLGMLIPLAGLSFRRSRRIHLIREELPHLLDMMARATRAGQSVEQAIEMVAAESNGVLKVEFENCHQQLQMGRSFERVMKSLAQRVRLVEFRILTTTLIVQKETGGRLSETLERMASVVRDRLNSQRQMRAATGAGRMSTFVIAIVAPVAYAFVFLFHREHLQVMFDDPLGQVLLMTALVLEIAGLIWVALLFKSDS